MPRTDFYIKVEMEHDTREQPDKLAGELCRLLGKLYGVRRVEVTHYLTHEEPR